MKRFFTSSAWAWTKVALELAVIVFLIVVLIGIMRDAGLAEEKGYTEGWVLCMPDNYVNVRLGPSRKSSEVGWKSTGDMVRLDGRKRNGYLHCVDGLGNDDGWIHAGYVVHDEPEYMYAKATIVSKGRLAARKYVDGKRTRWLKSGVEVLVYYWSEEWCLTNCGYVKAIYLELEGN